MNNIALVFITSPFETKYIVIIVFFISANADGLSLEFEWQQVSSSLQDSSQYSGRSQYCCILDGLKAF